MGISLHPFSIHSGAQNHEMQMSGLLKSLKKCASARGSERRLSACEFSQGSPSLDRFSQETSITEFHENSKKKVLAHNR